MEGGQTISLGYHRCGLGLNNSNYLYDYVDGLHSIAEPDQLHSHLDLSISKSSEWDRAQEDYWFIDLYDVVKHNVKNVEKCEIHDYLRKPAEPKTPQMGFETNSNLGFKSEGTEISNCERTESSLTRFLSELTAKILTQLNIFISVEHDGKQTLSELPNSIERACSAISKKLENSSMKRSNISIVLTIGRKTRRQAIGITRKF